MKNLKRKIRKWSTYKKSLVIFTLALLILGEAFLIYVSTSLKAYEKGDVNNYLDTIVGDIKKGKIESFITLPENTSSYEKNPDYKKGYEELFKGSITYKKLEDNTYDVLVDDEKILKVELASKAKHTKLGLLVYDEWETKNVESYKTEGIYSAIIDVDNNYDLYINDIKVDKKEVVSSSVIEGFEDAYNYVTMPKLDHYEIKNLSNKPKIEVKDKNGNNIKIHNHFAADFKKIESYDEAKKYLKDDFNPMDFAKLWSKFLTNDLNQPGTQRGLTYISPYTFTGSQMYKKAYAWASSIDITFTSIHNLDSFTNEKVANFTIYSDNAFSCEVYLEKNMTLQGGDKRTDKMHELMYWVHDGQGYKIVGMKTITE